MLPAHLVTLNEEALDDENLNYLKELERKHGPVPRLNRINKRALSFYFQLHSLRCREFPGSWQVQFDVTPIAVDGYLEAQHFLSAWDEFYRTINDIEHELVSQADQRSRRFSDREKKLRTG